MLTIIEQKTWYGYKQENVLISSAGSNAVPCTILWPGSVHTAVPYVIATHGATSSKHEWTELDGYTKGGNCAQELLASGIAVVAMDWHYHGDNDTSNLHGRNVFDDNCFDDFFMRSVADAKTVIDYTQQTPQFDRNRMGFCGYSLAGMFGFWLANRGVPFKTMLLCVPGVNRQKSSCYAPCNNLANLRCTALLQISAEHDEYIDFEEAKWLFAQIPVAGKRFLSFKSGHSLPIEYVSPAAGWIRTNL